MRTTTTDRLFKPTGWLRAARLAAIVIGAGLVVSATAARAQDEEQPEESFEQGIIRNIMQGLGGKSINDSSINYRERSPLVVPSNVTALPPPESGKSAPGPNWPKDPDEIERQEALAASRKPLPNEREAARPLSPSELNIRPSRKRRAANDGPDRSRDFNNNLLSPSQLGFKSSMLLSNMFGGTSVETKPFKGEPDRESLIEPPVGYQTPSPNFAYGSGPMKPLYGDYNPAAGEYGGR